MAIELPRQAGPSGAAPTPQEDSQQWAIQRRIEDVFTKLGEKFGDLSGRVVVTIRPETSFEDVGGIAPAKAAVRGFTTALTNPDLYRKWGISPPKGILLYGPRGTGKTMLARALATSAGAIFYHLKLMNLTSKFGPNTGELLQEIINIAKTEGRAVVYLDEANALTLEHLLPPPQAREASARLVAALCEKLDGLDEEAGEWRGQPEERDLVGAGAQVFVDGAHVRHLQAPAELDAEEPEAHVPDLPEAEPGLFHVGPPVRGHLIARDPGRSPARPRPRAGSAAGALPMGRAAAVEGGPRYLRVSARRAEDSAQ